jgi:hypothetical protein
MIRPSSSRFGASAVISSRAGERYGFSAGYMTGQILGGVPLAEAVKSQILVMFRQKNGTPQALSA